MKGRAQSMPLALKDIEKAFGKFRYSELGGGRWKTPDGMHFELKEA